MMLFVRMCGFGERLEDLVMALHIPFTCSPLSGSGRIQST